VLKEVGMRIAIIVSVTCLVIVVGTLLYVSNFTVYLGDDPTTCNNCHVMDAVYEGWYHGGHKLVATCNDCHTPHDLIPKYFVKARSGFNHVSAFTIGHLPDPLRAKTESREIVQQNCMRCHEETVSMVADGLKDSGRYCFECHRHVAHGERGISILPYQDTHK
jgi:cytochrome c nitrite reductase small subunit